MFITLRSRTRDLVTTLLHRVLRAVSGIQYSAHVSASCVVRTSRFVHLDHYDISRLFFALPGLRNKAQHINGRIVIPKERVVHAVILCIVAGVVLVNVMADGMGRESLLYRIFGERDIVEGPLPSGVLGFQNGSTGGNFAFAGSPLAGGIGEGDIEFELANMMNGNALVATNLPAISESDTENNEDRKEITAHKVSEGETPSTIAARYGISTNTVLWSNGISASDVIKVGDILVIPPVTGLVHEVKNGDTLLAIANKYNADTSDIMEYNGFGESEVLKIGQELIIPDGRIPAPAPRSVVASASASSNSAPAAPASVSRSNSASGFIWPTPAVRGISQYFGWRHTGIDIPNRSLPPVHASKAGTVTFSGWLGGYGRLVIIDHGGGVTTYYAHLNQQYVAKGARVSQGQAVGQLGNTGRSTGPHIHFEIRINGRPVNPLNYL